MKGVVEVLPFTGNCTATPSAKRAVSLMAVFAVRSLQASFTNSRSPARTAWAVSCSVTGLPTIAGCPGKAGCKATCVAGAFFQITASGEAASAPGTDRTRIVRWAAGASARSTGRRCPAKAG